MATDICIRRLTKELKSLMKDPIKNPKVTVAAVESNILEVHYVIEEIHLNQTLLSCTSHIRPAGLYLEECQALIQSFPSAICVGMCYYIIFKPFGTKGGI